MKVVFIYPDILKETDWPGYFYSGIGYLSSAVIRAGHSTSLIHIKSVPQRSQFINNLDVHIGNDPGALVAFSVTTNMFEYAREWAGWVKTKYTNKIMFGGVHATLNPDTTLAVPDIDYVCIGEGETALVEYLDRCTNGVGGADIQNLWIKENGTVIRNSCRPWHENLDTLAFPDRDIFDYEKLECERKGIGVFMASRGCPYDCYYCCNHALKAVHGDSKGFVRFRSVDNVIEEIKTVLKKYTFIKMIHFDDDILPMNKAWFDEFSQKYPSEIGLPFECNIRPNLVDESVVRKLGSAGCQTFRIGLESGNESIRNKILNRHLSEQAIIRAARLCRDGGIRLYTFNMVGLPGETMKSRLDTIKMNAKIGSDEEQISVFYPYEGTRLYDICKEMNLIKHRAPVSLFNETSLAFGPLERNRIVFTAFFFVLLVRVYRFVGTMPKPLAGCTRIVLDALLCSGFTAAIFYPVVIWLIRHIKKHGKSVRLARRIKHSFFRKSNPHIATAGVK